jgi:hypothetical protein
MTEPTGAYAARRPTVAAKREPDRRVHRERIMALRDALAALDGHGLHDTAHDRVRRLLACHECGHQPEQHEYDGGGCCTVPVGAPRFADTCPCAEWEAPQAVCGCGALTHHFDRPCTPASGEQAVAEVNLCDKFDVAHEPDQVGWCGVCETHVATFASRDRSTS